MGWSARLSVGHAKRMSGDPDCRDEDLDAAVERARRDREFVDRLERLVEWTPRSSTGSRALNTASGSARRLTASRPYDDPEWAADAAWGALRNEYGLRAVYTNVEQDGVAADL